MLGRSEKCPIEQILLLLEVSFQAGLTLMWHQETESIFMMGQFCGLIIGHKWVWLRLMLLNQSVPRIWQRWMKNLQKMRRGVFLESLGASLHDTSVCHEFDTWNWHFEHIYLFFPLCTFRNWFSKKKVHRGKKRHVCSWNWKPKFQFQVSNWWRNRS